MSRLFITDREVNFINLINKELIQKVIGEVIDYYAIDLKRSKVDDLYNEATQKVWSPPVQVNALVDYDNPQSESKSEGVDSKYTLNVYLHQQELQDRNVQPREGDFVEFGEIFYEVASATQPQLIFGQVNNMMMTKLTCVVSREGQFANGSDSREDQRNTHPVQQVIGVNS